ncbi:MAG: DUF1684 domain-containing protein [Lacisediminihabitans sp.]
MTLADFRAARDRAARGPRGSVAFVWGDFIDGDDQVVSGAPGLWSPAPVGIAGIVVTATAADGIRIGGALVDGTATLFHDSAHGPHLATFPGGAEGVVFSYDAQRFALQVWNPASELARGFARIDAYDEDPAWVLRAEVHDVTEGRTVAIAHHRDPRPVEVPVVAELRFEVEGSPVTLLAGRYGDDYLVSFRDRTSGSETYGSGRTLAVAMTGTDAATLDFNRATLLPCAFSHAWNCPLPPAENTLPFRVTAGERNVLAADGSVLL